MRPPLLLAAVLLAAVPSAQPVDGASLVVKRVYNLAPPGEADAPPLGALRRTEVETYGPDGRRQRVEWRAPGGETILALVELYADANTRRPYGALYVEGDLDPTLEAYTFLDDGRTKRVTYRTAAGEVTAITDFISDAEGREVERRYGNAEGVVGATDRVTYDGPNATGYVYARADGSRRSEYVYRVETTDARGQWTSRVVVRDGAPRALETRQITYRAE